MSLQTYWLVVPLVGIGLTLPLWAWLLWTRHPDKRGQPHRHLDLSLQASATEAEGSGRCDHRSARGRRKLAAWLKYLENRSRNAPDSNDPMATHDFTWLWQESKVEQLRN